jgi:hypothetical protein
MPSLTAFVFAHPGHEFRLLNTLSISPGLIHIFTHGSRAATSTARISASRLLAHELGVTQGSIFGIAKDRDFYQAILDEDIGFFDSMTTQLAASFIKHTISRVILDSWQNYNPIHDLTHLCGRLAVERVRHSTGQTIAALDYPVVFGELAAAPSGPLADSVVLDNDQIAKKLKAISDYPDIADDASALIRMDGEQALAIESLHHLLPIQQLFPTVPPFYEDYGRQRVASGSYSQVITWPHVQSIVTGLLQLQPSNLSMAA